LLSLVLSRPLTRPRTRPPVGGALGPSLAPQVRASRGLYKLLKPVADAYSNLSGYRKVGLKYDDILIEEVPSVQKVRTPALATACGIDLVVGSVLIRYDLALQALKRLTERENYDRAFRLRTAHMCAVAHAPLPKNLWVPKEAVSTLSLQPSLADLVGGEG
jgi:ubiquinol-cytochrome c reductase subunit 7